MKVFRRRRRATPAKLIFNPTSGAPGQSPAQLMEIVAEMQAQNFVSEVCLIKEGNDLAPVIQEARGRGIDLFVMCGGDGTINQAAAVLAGKHATLGIIPTGTRNNVARSFGIPASIPAAVRLLRSGQRLKVDVGMISYDGRKYPFMELCSVGLFAAIYSTGDELQRGNLARLGEFFTTLVASPPAEMKLVLDKKHRINRVGHGVVVNNTSFFGLSYQASSAGAMMDGLLDVLVFADLSKLDLLTGAIQMVGNEIHDPRIQRFQAKRIEIEMNPPMPIMADGTALGAGPLKIGVKRKCLTVMAGDLAATVPAANGATTGAAAR